MTGLFRRTLAVAFALLLVTTGFAPAVVVATTDVDALPAPAADRAPDAGDAAVSLLATQPPLVKKRAAIAVASNLSVDVRGERTKQRAVTLLNGTLALYRDDTRVEAESVFRDDAEALRALSTLDANRSRIDVATALVAAADRGTAEQAVADARRALSRTRDRIDQPGQVRTAEAHVENAERAIERAEAALARADRSDAGTAATERARALEHLATAWRQAQLAIDVVDAATSPQVRFVGRADPFRNGSTNATRVLVGNVSDVQAYELDDVTVQVNDRDPVTVPLATSTAPARNASFRATVTLSRRVNVITVTVRDAGDDGGPSAGGAGPAADTDTDTLRLDGDRLTDVFETGVVGMDPLDPDSDATTTDEDEGDDGTIDGHERFGPRLMPLFVNDRLGTSPFETDTDGDGLADGFEFRTLMPATLPTDADTDGDGVDDGTEDTDGDGLENRREQALGTDPAVADTDGDGLADGVEVDRGLDPLVADRDADGLDDGSEGRLGTDPDDPDTDDDGVPDGDELYTVRERDEDLGVSVAVTGRGDLAGTISIAENDDNVAFNNVSAAVSPFVELDARANVTGASVTMAYDGSAVAAGNESDLAVFRFDESSGTFEQLPSTVDADNDTVTAEAPGFSTFVVFKVPEWNANFEGDLPAGGRGGSGALTPVDTVFVMDSSGSMRSNDPNGFRKIAAKRFVGALLDIDRAAVVDFDSDASLIQPLSSNFAAVNASIDSLDASGGTDIGDGLRTANNHFATASGSDRAKIAILLSDGRTGDEDQAIQEAHRAAADDVTIITVGFGNPDRALMRQIATITGGQFHFVQDASDLPEVFSRVANNTTKGFDEDEDGLADNVESDGFPSGRGEFYTSDPNDPDTDGDGLNDSVEAGRRVDDSHFDVVSDPRDPDTDNDGLDDFDEVNLGTDPFDADTDDDALPDVVDPDPLSTFEFKDITGEDSPDFLTRASWILRGAALGDFGTPGGPMGPESSVPHHTTWPEVQSVEYLLGQILSGLAVAGDIRDLAANLVVGDVTGILLSAFGVITGIGDVAKIADEFSEFISYARNSRFVDEAFRFFNTKLLRALPEETADDLTRRIYRLTGRGDEFDDLARRGFSAAEIRRIFEALNRLPGRVTIDDVSVFRTVSDEIHIMVRLDDFIGVGKTLTDHLVGDLRRAVSKFPRSLSRDDVVTILRKTIERGRVSGDALKKYVREDAAGDVKSVLYAGFKPDKPGLTDLPGTAYTIKGWPGLKYNRNPKDDDRAALAPPRGLPSMTGPGAAAAAAG